MNVRGIIWLFVSIIQSNHIHVPNKLVLLPIEFSIGGWTPFLSPLTTDSNRQCTLIGLVKIFVSCVDFQIKFKTNLLPSKINRSLVRSQSLFCSLFSFGQLLIWIQMKPPQRERFIYRNERTPVQLAGKQEAGSTFCHY